MVAYKDEVSSYLNRYVFINFSRIIFLFLRSFVGDPIQYESTDSVEEVVRKVFETYLNNYKLFISEVYKPFLLRAVKEWKNL